MRPAGRRPAPAALPGTARTGRQPHGRTAATCMALRVNMLAPSPAGERAARCSATGERWRGSWVVAIGPHPAPYLSFCNNI
eukprot:357859-Chlamydomonas_euryale.AAC.14